MVNLSEAVLESIVDDREEEYGLLSKGMSTVWLWASTLNLVRLAGRWKLSVSPRAGAAPSLREALC